MLSPSFYLYLYDRWDLPIFLHLQPSVVARPEASGRRLLFLLAFLFLSRARSARFSPLSTSSSSLSRARSPST
jgi:hypothetical protein